MVSQAVSTRLVVIGASAGAVDVLRTILPAFPSGATYSVVVVVHVPEGRPSLLADIFAPLCALPVSEIDDKQPLTPGTIFFAPPGYHTLIEDASTLSLSNDDPENFSRPSIDVLFDSAAEALGAAVVGVLLTGASSDGAEGCARIRAAGGLVLAQDPTTCASATMPKAAIDRGAADLVLSPEAIASYFAPGGP